MEYTYRNIAIYYETYGSGRPILMIHGWSPDHRLMKGCMEPLFEGMDEKWERIYFDLPGMGKTRGKPWIDGSDRMLELVLGFIDGILPNRHYAVAGESYGGYLARGIVNKRPNDVDGVFLLCPAIHREDRQDILPPKTVLERDEAFLNSLTEEDRQSFESINVVQNERVWQKYREDILPGLNAADQNFLGKYLAQNIPFSFSVDKLEKPFMKPSLMLAGRQDFAVGYRDLWELIESYPRATFAVLDKAGHNLQIEQDVLFNALVKEWLERIHSETVR